MENPYAASAPVPEEGPLQGAAQLPLHVQSRGMVGHVRVLGVLMAVQGVMMLLWGVALIVIGIWLPYMMMNDPAFRQNPNGPPPEALQWIMLAVYGSLGVLHVISGSLLTYAGVRSFFFRGRTLAIVAISVGMTSIIPPTCYCAPTAVALLIYGLIVLLDNSVKAAFQLGDQGHSADQIDAMFSPYAFQKPGY